MGGKAACKMLIKLITTTLFQPPSFIVTLTKIWALVKFSGLAIMSEEIW